MNPVYLLTAEALDAADNPVTLRYASGDYHADGFNWPPRLTRPVLFAARARLPWLREGSSGIGDVELANPDGALDPLIDFALDGRALLLQLWDGSSLSTVLRGTISRTEISGTILRLILRDASEYLSADHPQAAYLGDDSGLEGDSDIAGRNKPQVLGSVSNATPVLVNAALQIYQVSSLADCEITAGRDRGVTLTNAGAFDSQAELLDESLTPSAGSFRHWRGYLRLGASAEALTVDAEQSAILASDVLTALVSAAGGALAEPPFEEAVYVLASGVPYELADGSDYVHTINLLSVAVGIYLDERRSTAEMIDELAASIGGYWRTDSAGDVALAPLRLTAPVASVPEHRITEIERGSGGAGSNGLPIHQVEVLADPVATVQTEVAAAATRKARWGSPWRSARASDPSVLQRHPLAESLQVATALRNDGQALADRLLTLLGDRRDATRITVSLAQYGEREIGETITVSHRRFGYAAGRDMLVLGRTPDADRNVVTLDLWG
jgi:hypothetical protein